MINNVVYLLIQRMNRIFVNIAASDDRDATEPLHTEPTVRYKGYESADYWHDLSKW